MRILRRDRMKHSALTQRLETAGIENASYEARVLLKIFAQGTDRDILSDKDITGEHLNEAVERREKRVPLQYIIGEVGFFREVYKVNENCLIPRSDTEHLVEYAVGKLGCGSRFLDLCTGSGCVAISTLKNTKDTTAVACDVSVGALALAKENAENNGVKSRLELKQCDLMSDCDTEDIAKEKFDAILSNPPYVKNKEYETLEKEIYFEPKIAFVGGEDGLDFYKRIVSRFKGALTKNGFFAFEIGYEQGEPLLKIAEENGFVAEIIKDYSGNDRVAVLCKK